MLSITSKIVLASAFICGITIVYNAKAEEPKPFIEGAFNYNLDANTDWYCAGKPAKATATVKAGLELPLYKTLLFSVYLYHESNPMFGYDRGQNGIGISAKIGGQKK